MATVRDTKVSKLGAALKNGKKIAKKQTPTQDKVQLTAANAPLFGAKFLEGIRDALNKQNELLQELVKIAKR